MARNISEQLANVDIDFKLLENLEKFGELISQESFLQRPQLQQHHQQQQPQQQQPQQQQQQQQQRQPQQPRGYHIQQSHKQQQQKQQQRPQQQQHYHQPQHRPQKPQWVIPPQHHPRQQQQPPKQANTTNDSDCAITGVTPAISSQIRKLSSPNIPSNGSSIHGNQLLNSQRQRHKSHSSALNSVPQASIVSHYKKVSHWPQTISSAPPLRSRSTGTAPQPGDLPVFKHRPLIAPPRAHSNYKRSISDVGEYLAQVSKQNDIQRFSAGLVTSSSACKMSTPGGSSEQTTKLVQGVHPTATLSTSSMMNPNLPVISLPLPTVSCPPDIRSMPALLPIAALESTANVFKAKSTASTTFSVATPRVTPSIMVPVPSSVPILPSAPPSIIIPSSQNVSYQQQSVINSPCLNVPYRFLAVNTSTSSPDLPTMTSPILSVPQIMNRTPPGCNQTLSASSPRPIPAHSPVSHPHPGRPSPIPPSASSATDNDCIPLNLTVKTPVKAEPVVEEIPEPMNLSLDRKKEEAAVEEEVEEVMDLAVKEEEEEDVVSKDQGEGFKEEEEYDADMIESDEKGGIDEEKQIMKMEYEAVNETDGKVCVEYEEVQFVWEDYMEETGSQPAPPTAFNHVECSLENSFQKGMKFEVSVKDDTAAGACWVAKLEIAAGQLLRLRWLGDDMGAYDFWCDAFSADVHALGWSQDNGKTPLTPPPVLKDKIINVAQTLEVGLKDAVTIPADLLEAKTGSNPIEFIKENMIVEIHHDLDPTSMWLAKVIRNVGGRLLLRYVGSEEENGDFWLFYLDYRLHPLEYGKSQGYQYKPPKEIAEKCKDNWTDVLKVALDEAQNCPFPAHLFKDREELPVHGFEVGHKMEALHLLARSIICPATVTTVIDKHYFLVTMDDLAAEKKEEERVTMCCHARSVKIFPQSWCLMKGLRITPPVGWKKQDFDWSEYLKETNSRPAPDSAFMKAVEHEFEKGMKLEAVHPGKDGQICAATITRIVDNLLWIHLDSSTRMVANHIVDVESHDLYPVGWCESNDYPLTPPRKAAMRRPKTTPSKPEAPMTAEQYRSATYSQIQEAASGGGGSAWCPKVYFNHRCFSGPFLSKGRIAELPRCVGPGPVALVMKEVLSLLINVAYKPSRVLREIQHEGHTNPSMQQHVLKAKYKGKSYRAMVELCKRTDQVEAFCQQMCIRLECCPNLFSTHCFNTACPETCSQLTKTKYNCYFGKKKKRKIGRPPGGHTNLEDGPKKPGKRRGRKKKVVVEKEVIKQDSDDSGSIHGSATSSMYDPKEQDADPDFHLNGESRKKKRKYTHHLPPPSEIKTRGVKLPSYSNVMFERRPRKPQTEEKLKLSEAVKVKVNDMGKIKKEQRSPQLSQLSPGKRRGRPPKNKKVTPPKCENNSLHLPSNPLNWSVHEVMEFFRNTDCANVVRLLYDQEIDGQALLLLNLPAIQEFMDMKLGPAIKFCYHIERVKVAFFEQYA